MNVLVIGYGNMGRRRAAVVKRGSEVSVEVVDPHVMGCLYSVKDVSRRPDRVFLCTPPKARMNVLGPLAGFFPGVSVLCEKPMANSVTEAEALLELDLDLRIAAPWYFSRFLRPLHKLCLLLEVPEGGIRLTADANMDRWGSLTGYHLRSGHGVLTEMGTHALYIVEAVLWEGVRELEILETRGDPPRFARLEGHIRRLFDQYIPVMLELRGDAPRDTLRVEVGFPELGKVVVEGSSSWLAGDMVEIETLRFLTAPDKVGLSPEDALRHLKLLLP